MAGNKETMVAIPADPNDPEDFDVSVAGLERAHMIRVLRYDLGMTQEEFAKTYGIPLANIRQYEIGRHMPPPAVRAYLKVIRAEPEVVKRVMAG